MTWFLCRHSPRQPSHPPPILTQICDAVTNFCVDHCPRVITVDALLNGSSTNCTPDSALESPGILTNVSVYDSISCFDEPLKKIEERVSGWTCSYSDICWAVCRCSINIYTFSNCILRAETTLDVSKQKLWSRRAVACCALWTVVNVSRPRNIQSWTEWWERVQVSAALVQRQR